MLTEEAVIGLTENGYLFILFTTVPIGCVAPPPPPTGNAVKMTELRPPETYPETGDECPVVPILEVAKFPILVAVVNEEKGKLSIVVVPVVLVLEVAPPEVNPEVSDCCPEHPNLAADRLPALATVIIP